MRKAVIVLILLAVIIVGFFAYWTYGNQPANAKDKESKIFVIQKGESIREIGNDLKSQGLIKDPIVFFLYIKLNGQDRNIQAGDYKLSPSMSLPRLIDTLNHGTLDLWITIPEGMRAGEIADILKETVPTYDESWLAELEKNEGYLFPDTYLIPRDADVATVISIMRNNFNSKVEQAGISDDQSLDKIVRVASLIEREAITDEEKPLIAGIIQNRLDNGIALQVDATVQYAKGYDAKTKKWWPLITVDDYKGVISPYNTYLNPGLPPAPISNPGIEAIKAAANPQDTPYVYYIHAGGKIYPARTLQEHNANVQKYL